MALKSTAEYRRGVLTVKRLIDNYDLPDAAEFWLKQRIAALLKPKRKGERECTMS